MIATHSSHSKHDENDTAHEGVPFATPSFPIGLHHAGSGGVMSGSAGQTHHHQQGGYTTGSNSQAVPHFARVRSLFHEHQHAEFVQRVPSRTEASSAIASFVHDVALQELFASLDDRLLFTAFLSQHPDALDRVTHLVEAVRSTPHVLAVRIEVDEEDGMVVVWVDLDANDDERLSVQMDLFDISEGILGELSDRILLAML